MCANLSIIPKYSIWSFSRNILTMKAQEPKVSIIIPAYNEEEELERLLVEINRDLRSKLNYDVIVVDDGSKDGTNIVAKEHGAKVLIHDRNHGYGYALRKGLEHASGSIVVFFDADGQIDPAEIPKLVNLIFKRGVDVVSASRYLEPRRRISIPNRIANHMLILLIRLLLGVKITDLNSGLKVFRRSVVTSFDLKQDGTAINIELATQAVKGKTKIVEVPITHRTRFSTRAKTVPSLLRILRDLVKLWGRLL